MSTAVQSNWQDSLAAVERSIGDCLSVLDRYESAFAKILQEPGRSVPKRAIPELPVVWDETLSEASRHADEVERLLVEQQELWGRWCQTFHQWQRMMQELPPGFRGASTTTQ